MSGRAVGLSALAASAVLAGCTVAPPPTDPPPPALEESYAGSMTVTPGTVRSGDRVRVWFPDARTRGIAFTLEASAPPGWRAAYAMNSGVEADDDPGPWAAGDQLAGIDIGIGGPGGQQLQIPGVAAAGVYRLCTANAPQRACSLLTVTR